MLKKLDPNWVGAIAAIVGVIVTILAAIAPALRALEIDWKNTVAIVVIGTVVTTLVAVGLRILVRWIRKRKEKRPPGSTSPPEPELSGQCFVEIHGAGFRREIPFRLDGNATLSIRGEPCGFGELLESIIAMDPEEIEEFDDPFQRALGEYLFQAILPALPTEWRDGATPSRMDIRIRAPDPRLLLLPWHALSDGGGFLCARGWTVALSGFPSEQPAPRNYTLPDSPKVLLVVPEPASKATTGAKAHLEELEGELSARNHTLHLGGSLQVADTWEAFVEKLEGFSPQVIYFYGPVDCAKGFSAERLCMATGAGRACREIGPEDLRTAIEKMPERPLLVYLNAIDNEPNHQPNRSDGRVPFAMALEGLIPAVITSRYLSSVDVAKEQGLKLLIDILTQGISPHRAVTDLPGKLESPATTAQARWMTPLLFRSYGEWDAKPAEPLDRKIHDPHWHLKLDRVEQIGTVVKQIIQMVKEGRPKCLAFVWYGLEGQGIERFHQRLNVELREYLIDFNAHLHEIPLDWPVELDEPEIAFRDCLLDAFHVRTLDDIPSAIRKLSQGASGQQTLVYARHAPVTSPRLMNPKSLKVYLDWWDRVFVPLLERGQFALMGVSFIVRNPLKFRNLVLERERLEDLALEHTVFRLLGEMKKLVSRDIVDFFKEHNIHLPIKDRDQKIKEILEKTGGHYEETVSELQTLVNQSWDLRGEEPAEETVEDEYDY